MEDEQMPWEDLQSRWCMRHLDTGISKLWCAHTSTCPLRSEKVALRNPHPYATLIVALAPKGEATMQP
jgi:hypothetical protein